MKTPQHLVVAADPVRYAKKLRFNRESEARKRARPGNASGGRDPLKRKARKYITNRLQRGKIQRQPCVLCGKAKSNAHHDDYSVPGHIAWLCTSHHADVHAERLVLAPEHFVDVPA